jgi:hypothetical protein
MRALILNIMTNAIKNPIFSGENLNREKLAIQDEDREWVRYLKKADESRQSASSVMSEALEEVFELNKFFTHERHDLRVPENDGKIVDCSFILRSLFAEMLICLFVWTHGRPASVYFGHSDGPGSAEAHADSNETDL